MHFNMTLFYRAHVPWLWWRQCGREGPGPGSSRWSDSVRPVQVMFVFQVLHQSLYWEVYQPSPDNPAAGDTYFSLQNKCLRDAEDKYDMKVKNVTIVIIFLIQNYIKLLKSWLTPYQPLLLPKVWFQCYRNCRFIFLVITITLQATSISLWMTAILSGSWVPMINRVSRSCARTWWDSKTQAKFLEKSNFHTQLTQTNLHWLHYTGLDSSKEFFCWPNWSVVQILTSSTIKNNTF